MPNLLILTVCNLLLTQALLISSGHYVVSALLFCSLATLILGVAVAHPRFQTIGNSCLTDRTISLILFSAGIYYALSLGLNPRLKFADPLSWHFNTLKSLNGISAFFGAAALTVLLVAKERRLILTLIKIAVFFALAAKLLVIGASPHPKIDVVTIGSEAIQRLMSGINPYRDAYPDIYSGEYSYIPRLSYPPGYLGMIFPFYSLLGDIRWASVFSDIAFTLLIVRVVNGPLLGWLLAWIWGTFPLSLFIIEQGWVDYLILPFAAGAFLSLRAHRWLAAGVLLGLLSTIKQHAPALNFFAVLWVWRNYGFRSAQQVLQASFAIVLLILLPWMILDHHSFYLSLISNIASFPPRMDSLSWVAFGLRHDLPMGSLPFILAGLLGFAVAVYSSIKKDPGIWLVGVSFLFLCLFIFAKQSFCNYYAPICGLLWLALASGLYQTKTSAK
ncbi:MAG: hypothetical protein KGQ59_10175 [Bdellovibrionales bacterium]|nr:hypothetical protein [Bdellovibrionales bacterium]